MLSIFIFGKIFSVISETNVSLEYLSKSFVKRIKKNSNKSIINLLWSGLFEINSSSFLRRFKLPDATFEIS